VRPSPLAPPIGPPGAQAGKALPFAGLYAVLRPNHVFTPTGRRGNGNPHVRGPFTAFMPSPFDVCFAYVITGIPRPVSAHVHRGRVGRTGPVVLTLRTPIRGNSGTASGCVKTTSALVRNIRRHPANYYVEVHGKYYSYPPGGMRGVDRVRGQLFLATRTQDR
jgi:CHRD domain-containing protein